MKITATVEQLSQDAEELTKLAFRKAVSEINGMFKPGYAEQHPELVMFFVDTISKTFIQMCEHKQQQFLSGLLDD